MADLVEDSKLSGDILWNDRWSTHTLDETLQDHADSIIPQNNEYKSAINWLMYLTSAPEVITQRSLYSTRRLSIISLRKAQTHHHGTIAQNTRY